MGAARRALLECERCGGALKVISVLTEPPVVQRILRHLGLPDEPPPIAPARALQEAFDFSA